MNILVLALSGIGDALMCTPAVRLLREARPDARIDALVMFEGVKEMFERNRCFESVQFFDFPKEGFARSLRFLLQLRGQYDATISVYPSNRREYNVISFLLGAEKRAGVKYLRMDVRGLGFLNNVRTVEDDSLHNVLQNIRVFGKLLGTGLAGAPDLEFPLVAEDREYAKRFLQSLGVEKSDTVVGFHPGGSTLKNHVNKRWGPEKYAALGKMLINDSRATVLVFGGPEERDLRDTVVAAANSPRIHGVDTDSLGHTAAIIERCDVFVSNDSSLLHVAAALKRKTVLVAGPINTKYSRPWNTEHRVVSTQLECSPCFVHSPRPLRCTRTDVKFKCLKELGVDMVYRAARELLRN